MKKILIFVTALAIMLAVPDSPKADDLIYGGINYEGNYGVFLGTGHTVGKVSIMPYARFSFDSKLQEGTRIKKAIGAETAIWIFHKPNYKFGLLASVFNVDWLDNQERFIGAYISQSAGVIGHYQMSERFGVAGWIKAKAQIFKQDTSYKDNVTFGIALVTDKLW